MDANLVEERTMTVELDEPDRAPLRNASLALAACEIKFADPQRRLGSKDIFRYRDALNRASAAYGELTQVRRNQMTLQLGMLGGHTIADEAPAVGWRLATRDQAWAIMLFNDSVSIENRKYEGWSESFRPRLHGALAGAIDAFGPEIETRIGLRYVNQFNDERATSGEHWGNRLQPAFAGPLLSQLGPGVNQINTRIGLSFDDIESVITLIVQRDINTGQFALAFDIDVFRQGAREFSFKEMMDMADLLNTRALQIFQRIITPEFREELT
jgi:uncharacterized protein (TIGR04255 family)